MATAGNDVDDIRREMAQIRMHMHEDVQAVVAGAEAAADWRHYIRLYPWASLAAAFGVGYFVVPRRRRSIRAAAQAAAEATVERVKEAAEGPRTTKDKAERKGERKGIIGTAFAFLVPIALRAAQGYAAQYVEALVAQQGGFGPPPQQAPGPAGRPGARRPS